MHQSVNRTAIAALLIAGFGWGTTGLFVRSIGGYGISVYELLLLRLLVTGIVITPFIFPINLRKSTFFLGLSMVFYYLGAITAFTHLQLVVAALIIGSSPLLAWVLPFVLERRLPRKTDVEKGIGVGIALLGLALLVFAGSETIERPPMAAHPSLSIKIPWLGLLGAIVASGITVGNARFLSRDLRPPKPIEITFATVIVGLVLGTIGALVFPDLIRPHEQFEVFKSHPIQVIGFGVLATAVPGLAIAYAAVRLTPQATSTVSIQLQVWSGVLAWIILGESMSVTQIIAAGLVLIGSWVCVRHRQ